MVSDAVITRILEYLRDNPDGYVDDLLKIEGVDEDAVKALEVFVISVSNLHNRYHVHGFGQRYIKVVL